MRVLCLGDVDSPHDLSHSPPSPRRHPHRSRPPSAGGPLSPSLGSLEGGGRPESAFKKPQGNFQPRIVPAVLTRRAPRFPADVRPIGAPFPVPSRIGRRGFPDSRFRQSRESGVPTQFPGEIGNGGKQEIGDFVTRGLRPPLKRCVDTVTAISTQAAPGLKRGPPPITLAPSVRLSSVFFTTNRKSVFHRIRPFLTSDSTAAGLTLATSLAITPAPPLRHPGSSPTGLVSRA